MSCGLVTVSSLVVAPLCVFSVPSYSARPSAEEATGETEGH